MMDFAKLVHERFPDIPDPSQPDWKKPEPKIPDSALALPTLRERIVACRQAYGWSGAELARQTDISPQQIHRYESGTTPGLDDFFKLAQTLRVDPEALYYGA